MPDLTATLSTNSPVQDVPISLTTVTDDGDDVSGTATYQWMVDTGSGFVNATGAGATTTTYTPIEADEGGTLEVVISLANDEDNAGNTETATLVASNTIADSADLFGNLSDLNPVQGSPISLTTVTDGGNDVSGTATYQWMVDTGSGFLDATGTGATSTTYTPTEADEGGTLEVVITYADQGGIETATVVAPGTIEESPDDLAVTFSGLTANNPMQGAPVTVTDITDGGLPVSNITYQWQRDSQDISNATSATYTPVEADEGQPLAIVVSFTDANGTTEFARGNAGTVAEIAGGDELVTLDGLTDGNAVERSSVNVHSVTDGGVDPGQPAYQWQLDGVDIPYAVSSQYTPVETDEGHALTVDISFTDVAGNSETVTASAGTVQDAFDASVNIDGVDSSSGNAVQGTAVTVTGVTDQGQPGTNVSYQWQLDGSDITGATNATYTPLDGDEGKELTVNVSFTDANGLVESGTGSAGTVEDSNDELVPLSGLTANDAVQGTAVTVTDVTDGGQPVSNITYQWQRNGGDITGATSASYTPSEDDEGHALTVNVGFTDGAGNAENATGDAGIVAEIAGGDEEVTLSGLTGGNAVQDTPVTVDVTDDGLPASDVSYQWQIDGRNIRGATSATYTPTQDDEGQALTVNISFSPDETATASAGIVQDSADTEVTLSGLAGGNAVEGTMVSVTDVTDGGTAVSNITYQWQRDGSDIGGATSASYMPAEGDEGHALTVNVGFTDGNSDAETASGNAGTVQENPAENAAIAISGLNGGGNAVEGTQLTASLTEGDAPASGITYTWKVNGATVHSGVDGAGNTYTPGANDAGEPISVAVSFTDTHGFAETGSMLAGTVQGPVPAPPAGTTADMIMSQPSTGNYEIYDIGNNSVLAAYPLTQTGSPWQAVNVGGFNGSDTSDLLLRNGSTGAFELYDVSGNAASGPVQLGAVGTDWSVLGFGDFSGNPGETDMLMRQNGTAKMEAYDISNNQITGAASMGAVGPEWQFLGVGDFSSNPNETDLLMRDGNNGALEVYNINHNAIVSATGMGAIGVEWQFVGVGDFSGNAGETDMLMRDVNNGALEVYNIHNDQVVSAQAMGAVGLEWTPVGIGDFSGNPEETDMIMRDANNGAFEIYDIKHDSVVSASSIGAVGTDWQTVGIAPYQSAGAAVVSGNSQLDLLAPAAAPLISSQIGGAAPGEEVSAPLWAAGNAAPIVAGSLFQHA